MVIWRLMASHVEEERDGVVNWTRKTGQVVIGWGQTGDLQKLSPNTSQKLRTTVAGIYGNPGNSIQSLWAFYNDMKIGDLVILNTSKPALVMRVTSDYYYAFEKYPGDYYHRRKAEMTPLDPNVLWRLSGGKAAGQSIYGALIRCANEITDREYNALTG